MAIDLLITKETEEVALSERGWLVNDVDVSSASLQADFRNVKGRNGRILSSARFINKNIKVTGTYVASSLFASEQLKDEINRIVVDDEPYYITQLLPLVDDLYNFEKPGESDRDIDLINVPHSRYHYRFKVLCDGGVVTTFLGKSNQGLLFRFSIDFTTAELPFGETTPRNIAVDGGFIKYEGTAKNSQLEYPWQLKLTATESQPGTFTVTIGDRTFEHTSEAGINTGDVFILKGIETTKNGENINEYTNYEHFELVPSTNKQNVFETTFVGEVELIDFVEFYK